MRLLPSSVLHVAVVAAAITALAPAPAAQGAPGTPLAWERVGDTPHDAALPFSFGPDGYAWSGWDFGVFRLAPPHDAAALWEHISGPPRSGADWVYLVGPDTLIVASSGMHRSTDGGRTWVRDRDTNALDFRQIIQIPAGLPHAGRIVAATDVYNASYSDDRGATWISANPSGTPSDSLTVERLALVTAGPRAGRLVGAGLSGATISDDGGATWRRAPAEHAYYQQRISCVAALRGRAPGGGDRVVGVVNDIRVPTDSVYVTVSDDGGETWRRTQGLWPGAFRTCVEVVDLGGGRAAAVMMRGPVWGTADGGETWSRWGEHADFAVADARAWWAVVGPDGRLYVGVRGYSGGPAWEVRTAVPVAAVSSEPEGPGAPARGEGLGVRVRPNPSQAGRVAVAWDAAGLDPELGRARVTVVDVRGRAVLSVEAAGGAGGGEAELDTSSLAAGVYAVRVEAAGVVGAARLTVAR